MVWTIVMMNWNKLNRVLSLRGFNPNWVGRQRWLSPDFFFCMSHMHNNFIPLTWLYCIKSKGCPQLRVWPLWQKKWVLSQVAIMATGKASVLEKPSPGNVAGFFFFWWVCLIFIYNPQHWHMDVFMRELLPSRENWARLDNVLSSCCSPWQPHSPFCWSFIPLCEGRDWVGELTLSHSPTGSDTKSGSLWLDRKAKKGYAFTPLPSASTIHLQEWSYDIDPSVGGTVFFFFRSILSRNCETHSCFVCLNMPIVQYSFAC